MLCQIAGLCLFSTIANAIHVGEEQVFVPAVSRKFGSVIRMTPVIPFVEMNTPSMRGTMSFTGFELQGTDTLLIDAKLDPVGMVLYFDATSPYLSLVANYTARLHFYKNDTFVEGAGRFRISVTGYQMTDVRFPVQYRPTVRKFQTDFPTNYEPHFGTVDAEITGLKNALTGKEISVVEYLELSSAYERPSFVELWRQLGNVNMERGYAQRLGNAFLHSFFEGDDPDI